jgi:flagellar hook-associated protein 3 FlgL
VRIADKMQYNQVQKNISKNRTDMSDLQNQAATQRRINKPSDDPLSTTRVLASRTEEKTNTQFTKNINQAKSFLEFTDQSLSELTELLVRAKELAISQSNDASAGSESRKMTAKEVEQIYNQSVQIANRKLGERYIFSGFKTQTKPFDITGEYSGDDGDLKIQTQKDHFLAVNLPGSTVFMGKGLQEEGVVRPGQITPQYIDDLPKVLQQEDESNLRMEEDQESKIMLRGPASTNSGSRMGNVDPSNQDAGVNVFKVIKGLEISLKTNDKVGIQSAMDMIDQSISQIVLGRSEVGSRVMAINGSMDSLQKAIVDNKIVASQLEDSDVFKLVSDINKADTALKATLDTSGKMIQPSLLDFLR